MVSDGLSEVIGFWKIMAMRLPRIRRIASSRHVEQRRSGKPDLARDDAPASWQEAHDGVGSHRLAGARLADDADDRAAANREADFINRPQRWLAAPLELDCEIRNLEQYLARRCGPGPCVPRPTRSLAESQSSTSHGSLVRIEHVAQTVADEVEGQRDERR